MRPSSSSEPRGPQDPPTLDVTLPDGRVLRFSRSFHIGRDPDCEVQVQDAHVSRRHALVSLVHGQWNIRDLQSSNGLLVDGERVESASIGESLVIQLGGGGPRLGIGSAVDHSESPETRDSEASEDSVILDRYLHGKDGEEVGGRTMMIRRALNKYQQQQRRRYLWLAGVAMFAAVAALGYAYRYVSRAHAEVERLRQSAEVVFYQMKEMDVTIAELQQENASSAPLKKYLEQRRQMEANYEQEVVRLYDRKLSESDKLILRVTRLFGECELAAPPEYLQEVKRYIRLWKSTHRYENALRVAQERGYTRQIAEAFRARNLPPQFFYLAMQESSFDTYAVGKPTRWGIAKGMWQFIPDTGKSYGLTIGSLFRQPQFDPQDDRMNWEKATPAAASYIKYLYATDAQASGLLVMASYNWGQGNVIELVRTLPKNPKQRNFWSLLAQYRERIPPETYNYVFYIVSAAVIGENPRFFEFNFDNPLAQYR
jgi:membrane-bound lytic murein transglycosylase D